MIRFAYKYYLLKFICCPYTDPIAFYIAICAPNLLPIITKCKNINFLKQLFMAHGSNYVHYYTTQVIFYKRKQISLFFSVHSFIRARSRTNSLYTCALCTHTPNYRRLLLCDLYATKSCLKYEKKNPPEKPHKRLVCGCIIYVRTRLLMAHMLFIYAIYKYIYISYGIENVNTIGCL